MVKVSTAVAAAVLVVSTLAAQGPPPAPQTPPTQGPPAAPPGQGRGRGNPGVFPAQQRPPGDPAVVARGKTLYSVTCSFCHGPDLRGGQLNGPNLLRSQLVLSDQAGELILPVVHEGRPEKGMPPIPMPDEDVKAVAEYIHSMAAQSPRQGMPPPSETPVVLDILVGDAGAGRTYFEAKCSTCHSPTGDLQGIATRIPDAKALQNLWVSGGGAGGRGRPSTGSGQAAEGRGTPNPRTVTVTVTLPSGEKAEGRLVRLDDFIVTLAQPDGIIRSFRRNGAVPKVDVHDPLEPHRTLLSLYTDKDMHDVTAYLATLK
jgi:cytochrome c oxidase cbb3-type subunit 3